MKRSKWLLMALSISCSPAMLHAADYSDPTWPCIQRKVEQLSPGLMWPYPLETLKSDASTELKRNIKDLAGILALRRVELDQVQPQVAAFAQSHKGDPIILGHVFEDVFQNLSKRRMRIIKGIGDFSLSQIGLSEQIDHARVQMDSEMAKDAPDYDKVDKLEEQLDWDQLIYTDRQRSITYLCETPQIIERRLFAIAQMLQGLVQEQG